MARTKSPRRMQDAARQKEEETNYPEADVADAMWLELDRYHYPDETVWPSRLWLLVDNIWAYLILRPEDLSGLVPSVQSAFCKCPDYLEVVVWYFRERPDPSAVSETSPPDGGNYDIGRIVGLVVRSRSS